MSVNMFKFDRKSICATCLSQDRMLFAVKDLPACAKFYSELSLKWTDKLCWECQHMVRKLVLFKNKANKAQAWLRNATTSQRKEIPCLSTLGSSTGLSLNVTDPGLTSSPTKHEPDLASIKKEVIDDEDGAAASEGEIKIKEEQIEIEVELEQLQRHEVGFEEPKPAVKSRKRKLTAPLPIQSQPDLFTEQKLSEDGLTEWWQRKKKMKFFTQSLPDERCDQCVQPFDCEQLAAAHAKKHTEVYGDFECDICEQRLVDERHLEFHKKLHYRVLKCNCCNFVWDEPNTMRDHCSDVHGVKQTLWDCEPCKKQFPSNKKYMNHMRAHRRTSCPECGKVMNKMGLNLHMRMQHRGARAKRRCGECGGIYRDGEEYRAHVEAHRKEADPAAFCTECMTQFKSMPLFRTHMKHTQGHAAEKEFRSQCRFCSMKFIKQERLRQHRQLHNDIPCDQCELKFISEKARDSHIKKTHEKPRDILCDYCGRGFTDKAILVQHINTHTDARPFVCKLCGADFGHKSALYLHGRLKHKIPRKKVVKKDSQKKIVSAKDNLEDDKSVNKGKNDNHANSQ